MRVTLARMLVAGALGAYALPAAAFGADPPPTTCPPETPPTPTGECGPPPPVTPPAHEVLSVPGQVSRWAFVIRKTIARRQPRGDARGVARLHLKTQDGTDELVLALERFT